MITAEDILKEKGDEIISVAPDCTLHDTLKVMMAKRIGAILVKQG